MARTIKEILEGRSVDRGKIDAEKARLIALIEEQQQTTKEKD